MSSYYGKVPIDDRLMIKEILAVPLGLRELMSDISREVLRCNPENLYLFISDYLNALLNTRENARAAFQMVEQLRDESQLITRVCAELDLTVEKGESVAKVIQKGFKKYIERNTVAEHPPTRYDVDLIYEKLARKCSLSSAEINNVATIIQRAYRSYRLRKIKYAANRTRNILKDSPVPGEDAEHAATVIQAVYRGYCVRKVMKSHSNLVQGMNSLEIMNAESVTPYQDEEIVGESNDIKLKDYDAIMHEIKTSAASVIQRAFRKHKEQKVESDGHIKTILDNLVVVGISVSKHHS